MEIDETIESTRGDTIFLKFQRKDKAGIAILDIPSAMYLTVKKNYKTREVLIQKTLEDFVLGEDGYWHIRIRAEDTENLPYGGYVFDIQVNTETYTKTIRKGELILLEEVTFKENEV